MKPSEEKQKLVKDLTELHGQINVERLVGFPRQPDVQEWLAEIAAIFKNLDEADYQEIVRLSKTITPTESRINRTKAAHEIFNFVRRKIAEYKRYNFKVLDNEDNGPKLMFGKGGRPGQPGGGGGIYIQGQVVNIADSARLSADGGDVYSTSGNNSPLIINKDEITTIISRLENEIEQNYNKTDKEEVKTLLKELKLSAEEGNENKFKQLGGILLTRGAEVAQIASSIIQLLTLGSG